jgi:hypothetical protein
LRQFEAQRDQSQKRQLVIAVSANFTSTDHCDMVGPGKFDAVIPKPISVLDIKHAIADYIAGRLPLKPSEDTGEGVKTIV